MRKLLILAVISLAGCASTPDLGITCAPDLTPEYCERVTRMHEEWAADMTAAEENE